MRADRRLYLDRAQATLVPEHSPEAAWLLVAKGHEIPAAEVKRLGLVMHEGRVMQGYPEEPAPAVEMTPEPVSDTETTEPTPIMPPQSRRSRRKKL